jgi:glycyl-tRNA synthetase
MTDIKKHDNKKMDDKKNNSPDKSKDKARDDLISYISEKGFVYGPSPEIYGGVSGFYDFGPLGKLLKNNVENTIRKVFSKSQFYEIECPIVMPKIVWEASGHLSGFSDPLVSCQKCKSIFRADNLVAEQTEENVEGLTTQQLEKYFSENPINCPSCKERIISKVVNQNLMLKTNVGLDIEMYNRPETATTSYLPFLNYLRFFRDKLPFGIFQIGNAYRNEISPRQHILRGREFTQAEAQLFLFKEQKENFEKFSEVENLEIVFIPAHGKEIIESLHNALKKKLIKNKAYGWALGITYQLFKEFGFEDKNLRFRQHEKMAFYADDAWDLEINLNSFGWTECCGVHDRTDYDLKTHSKFSGKNLIAVKENGEKEIPSIIEIAMGPNRILFAVLDQCYNKKEEEEGKTKLHLPKNLAPIKAAIFPLMKKEELQKIAKEIFDNLIIDAIVQLDESGSIGKRYLRQDSIGTPYCITIDYDSVNDKSVTVRDRDTEKQERVKIKDLKEYLKK